MRAGLGGPGRAGRGIHVSFPVSWKASGAAKAEDCLDVTFFQKLFWLLGEQAVMGQGRKQGTSSRLVTAWVLGQREGEGRKMVCRQRQE